jgi:crotonobetainyl-CoA:carnitine CoA-transferase CaiB-like acyl-CoA transferase
MSSNNIEGSLANLRVLDFAQGGTQICGKILADLGADVIKIEPPGGDTSGRIAPFYHDIPDPEKSLFWFAYNTNKRSITLNIETSDGQLIFKKLAKVIDLVIESFPPGYLDTLGLGYEVLNELNPKIILTSITPFGQTGPKAHYKGCDLIAWASSGGLYATGDPDRPPVWTSFPQPSIHAGVEACVGSLIAYWDRIKNNEGQHVDVSIQDTFVGSTDQAHILTYELTGYIYHRQGNKMGFGISPARKQLFACKDGFVAFQPSGGTSPNTESLVQWMLEEGMATDWLVNYDWVNDYDGSRVSQAEINRVEIEFSKFFMTKTKTELLEQAINRSIQLVPINTIEDIYNSEQLKARNFWVDVKHDELNCILRYCGLLNNNLSETPGTIRRRAPLIGEHNLDIYEKELGVNREDLIMLKNQGVI